MERIKSNGNKNRHKESGKVGSRYMVLGEDMHENYVREAQEETEMVVLEHNGLDKSDKTKGKRPAVQVNEKQIMGSYATSCSKSHTENMKKNNGEAAEQYQGKRVYHKAGALEEHTVVRGEQNGAIITATKVLNQDDGESAEGLAGMDMGDHHNDPPGFGFDDPDGQRMDFVSGQGTAACMHTLGEGMHEDVDMGC